MGGKSKSKKAGFLHTTPTTIGLAEKLKKLSLKTPLLYVGEAAFRHVAALLQQ